MEILYIYKNINFIRLLKNKKSFLVLDIKIFPLG